MDFRSPLPITRNFCFLLIFLICGAFARSASYAQDVRKPLTASDQAASTPSSRTVIKSESRMVLVDAVVTDKKGNYIHDLTQQDFKVYEDSKEQFITSFSSGSDAAVQASGGRKHYLILYFDNASMERLDQMNARSVATKFIEQNAADDAVMAIADFGGSLQIKQEFTTNAELFKSAIGIGQTPEAQTNPQSSSIEKCNYNQNGNQQQMYGLAVSTKRYVVYRRNARKLEIVKPSEHGLGIVYVLDKRSRYKPVQSRHGRVS